MSISAQTRTYYPENSIVFLKTNEPFGGLSNMAPGFPLLVNGCQVRTAEALYQACRFPSRPDVQALIIDEKSPMTAKMKSKPFRSDTRGDWDTVRVEIMKWCLRVKLAQNMEKFGSLLLATGEHPIVEKNIRKQDFWSAKEMPDGSLVGQNVLGRLLMEVRERFKNGRRDSFTIVEPLNLEDFDLLGAPIKPVLAQASCNEVQKSLF